MTAEPAKGTPHASTGERAQRQDVLGLEESDRDALLAYVGKHLTLVRQSASGQRPMYWILGIGVVVGLAAHIGGFLLKPRRRQSLWRWWPTCSVSHCGSVSSWWCSSRSGRRSNGASTNRPSTPMRRRQAVRPEPEVARPRTPASAGEARQVPPE